MMKYTPDGLKVGIPKDFSGNPCSVHGRIGVHGPDDDLQLRKRAVGVVLAFGDQREGTGPLAVETHVLCERLSQSDLVTVLQERTDSGGVTGHVAWRNN